MVSPISSSIERSDPSLPLRTWLFRGLPLAALVGLWFWLPDSNLGPLGIFNPKRTLTMMLLIVAIYSIGSWVRRRFSARAGLLVLGLVGGLVSSTAVTVSVGRFAKLHPHHLEACSASILAACGLMFARVLVEVLVLDFDLATQLWWPLGASFVASMAGAMLMHRRAKAAMTREVDLEVDHDPVGWRLAAQFTVLYAAVVAVMRVAEHYAGDRGLYISSILAGTNDVDAVTLATIELHRTGLSAEVAVVLIFLACATNSLVKTGLCAWLAGRRLFVLVGTGMGAAMLVGALAWLIGSQNLP